MNGKVAAFILVGICIIIAILLLTKIIEIIIGTVIFAIALVVLGILSKNFRKKNLKGIVNEILNLILCSACFVI